MNPSSQLANWPWWAIGAAAQFIAGAAIAGISAILCNPAWGYNISRRFTWLMAAGGVTFLISAPVTVITQALTWKGLAVSVIFAAIGVEGLRTLYCRAHERARLAHVQS